MPKKGSGGGKNWFSTLLGLLFILAAMAGIVHMLRSLEPEGRMVCDTDGRPVSLTKFGACRMEK